MLSLVGCATHQPRVTYEQMASIRVDNHNCPQIDNIIGDVRNQLRMRGTLDKNPEDLSEEDRKYNEKAKVIIWSLIIGCNNTDRYK
jgi:hypothetical protein